MFDRPELSRVTFSLLQLGFLMLPFWFWPMATIPFEVPKVTLTLIWVMGMVLLTVVSSRFLKNPTPLHPQLFLSVAIFCTILCLASLWGVHFQKSIFGNPYRQDGLLTVTGMLTLAFVVANTLTKKNFGELVRPISLSALGLSLLAMSEYALIHGWGWGFFPDWQGAVGATFGQPNFLGGYLLVTLPIVFFSAPFRFVEKREKWWWLTISLQIFAIFLTYSWGAIGGVGLFFALVLAGRYLPKKYVLGCWLACTAAATLAFLSLSFYQSREVFIFESRTRIFQHLFAASLERPWLGWGVANIDYAFRSSALQDNFQYDVYVDKAHSEVLEVVVSAGLLGGVAYVVLISFVIHQLWLGVRQKSGPHFTSILVLLLYLYHTQTNVVSISEQQLFWLVVGLALRKTAAVAET